MHNYNKMTQFRKKYRRSRFSAGALLALAVPVLCFAAKEFSMPKAQPAFSYPAHDHHANESVTVAVDPYDTPAKANIFVVNYRQHDLLPMFLVITNDSDQPIQLVNMKAELITSDRTKLTPDTEDDIFRRVSHPNGSATHYPLPFPTSKTKGGINAKEANEIQSALFRAKAVEPHSSQIGFFFFDVSDVPNPLPGAHFYLTGVQNSSGNDLMYFEIPLDKYLESAKQQH
jgi:hypothetical protein